MKIKIVDIRADNINIDSIIYADIELNQVENYLKNNCKLKNIQAYKVLSLEGEKLKKYLLKKREEGYDFLVDSQFEEIKEKRNCIGPIKFDRVREIKQNICELMVDGYMLEIIKVQKIDYDFI